MNVGVVGLGFVGGAVSGYFESYGDTVYGYDIKSGLAINNEYTKIVENCEIIFVCLPTPRSDDGSCDTSIVHDALCRLDYIAGELKKSPMVLIKSTLGSRNDQKICGRIAQHSGYFKSRVPNRTKRR